MLPTFILIRHRTLKNVRILSYILLISLKKILLQATVIIDYGNLYCILFFIN